MNSWSIMKNTYRSMLSIYAIITFPICAYASMPSAAEQEKDQSCSSSSAAVRPIVYTTHALEQMKKRKVTKLEVEKVIKTGRRGFDDSDGRTPYFEKKNKVNPLKVVLATTPDEYIVITIFRQDPPPPSAGNRQNLKDFENQKKGKSKDLAREARK